MEDYSQISYSKEDNGQLSRGGLSFSQVSYPERDYPYSSYAGKTILKVRSAMLTGRDIQ
jgi:hypothetical protein